MTYTIEEIIECNEKNMWEKKIMFWDKFVSNSNITA